MPEADIKEVVRNRYGEIARNVRAPGSPCCYDGERGSEGISANLYAADETKSLPQDALAASLGCGAAPSRASSGGAPSLADGAYGSMSMPARRAAFLVVAMPVVPLA